MPEKPTSRRLQDVAGAALVLFLAYAPRAVMPYLLPSYLMAVGVERETFTTMLTVQSLVWGLSGLVFGLLADRGHARPVLVLCALVYAAGLVLLAFASGPAAVIAGGGVMAGIGLGGTTFAVLAPALATRGALAMAAAGAAASALAFTPLVQMVLVGWDARTALLSLAAIVAGIAALARLLPRHAAPSGGQTGRGFAAIAAAVLFLGALASGFQTGLVSATLGVTAADAGLGVEIAVGVIVVLNLGNLLGAGLAGLTPGRPALALALIFLWRAAAFAAILALPMSAPTALGFAAAAGLGWLAALPLSIAALAAFTGGRRLGALTGLLMLGWQAGAMIAVAFAVETYGWWGHYRRGWEIALALGLMMALAHAALAHARGGDGGDDGRKDQCA